MEGETVDHQDAFTTETAGLPEASPPGVVRLRDGDAFDLRIHPVRKKIGDAEVRMLGYNGSIPGPTMQVDQGSEITVNVRNDGDVETTVHWHGLRLRTATTACPRRRRLRSCRGGRSPTRSSFPTRALLVPPSHQGRFRPGDGPLRSHSGRALRPLLLAPRGPAHDHHARRRAHRRRQDGALQPLGSELRRDGPVRQRHAHKRRDSFLGRGGLRGGRAPVPGEHGEHQALQLRASRRPHEAGRGRHRPLGARGVRR